MAGTGSRLVRAIVGTKASNRTPETNVGLVNAIAKQLGVNPETDKQWAKKVADNVGVHPDTVRRWRRGQRPTLNTDLVKTFRRNNLKRGREARLGNSDGPVVTAVIIVSETAAVQRMHLGRFARTDMRPPIRNMAQQMMNDYLAGGNPERTFNKVIDAYLNVFGGELDEIRKIEF